MAGICCGVVGESEPAVATAVEQSSRASRRRRLELRPFKFVADVAVPPPLENGPNKRHKLDLCSQFPLDNENNSCSNNNKNDNAGVEIREAKRISGVVCDGDRTRNEDTVTDSKMKSVQVEGAEGDSVQERPKFGFTSVCGRRRDMEDAVSIHTSFFYQNLKLPVKTHFFGVFDGHGCSHVAMKCKDRLHEIVKAELENFDDVVEWEHTMERSFDRMDKEVQDCSADTTVSNCRCELQTPQCDAVGSTAVVAVVTTEKIIVSNCGDSRAILCRNGVAVQLSDDHKPDRPDELIRIQAAGGRVIYWDGPRVLGVLAMSRAIGDNYLKPYVISEPEVTVVDRTGEDECLILASDGLWDVVSNETACSVVRSCFRSQRSLSSPSPSPSPLPGNDVAARRDSSDQACLDASILLTKLALARKSTDNVSVVVVDLRRNQQL
ncbi:hypothetical protein Ddye_032152 [Dipteronia dyeriana]|uniref:protein-serine/threonine phosphatase n=1 Tax=Dipteronia dyeriana TaxID=168575 RepID=A0AAD9TKV1_9ROSI|nr:hypothetical protein Ddye_032152 [Dipteronia dyeriana]